MYARSGKKKRMDYDISICTLATQFQKKNNAARQIRIAESALPDRRCQVRACIYIYIYIHVYIFMYRDFYIYT